LGEGTNGAANGLSSISGGLTKLTSGVDDTLQGLEKVNSALGTAAKSLKEWLRINRKFCRILTIRLL
jgi:hypothetical protein